MRPGGAWERLLRWAVGDDEATEGLLGDLDEEWARWGGPAGGWGHRAAVLGLAARYAAARLLGGGRRSGGRTLFYALRSLRRAPGFAAAFSATLALGLGATAAVFTVLDGVVLRPLQYDEPGSLVRLRSAVPGLEPGAHWHLAKAQFFYVRDEATTLASAALYANSVATVAVPDDPSRPATRVRTSLVGTDLFRVLRLRPLLGRAFTRDETSTITAGVALLTHGSWVRAFGSDPDVVGRELLVDGRPTRIVGVLPPGARLPEEAESRSNPIDLWLPLYLNPAERAVNQHTYRSVARLAPGADVDALNRELLRMTARLPELFPSAYSPQFMEEYGFRTVASPLHEDVVGGVAGTLWTVLGAVAILLLVACFNAANLLLARSRKRRRELAIRAALGAGRRTLGRQLLCESLLLAGAACVGAAALGSVGVRLLVHVAPAGVPRLDEVAMGFRHAGLTVGAALALGVVFGVLPLAGARGGAAALGDTGRGLTPSRSHHAVRRALVVAQLAASLVLLAGATLLFRSFHNLTRVDVGIDVDQALLFRVILPSGRYGSYQAAAAFYREAAERVESLPGVTRVGMVSALPLDGYDGCAGTEVEGQPAAADEDAACLPVFLVSPGYFEAAGIPVEGATAAWTDLAEERSVAVVSRSMAARFWPGENPVGRGVNSFGAGFVPVSGVAGDVRGAGLREAAWDAVYLSFLPERGRNNWAVPRFLHFVVRLDRGDPLALAPTVRATLAEIDPQVPLSDVRAGSDLVATATARDSFVALLLGVASALSLLLSGLGVYAVIAYIVQGRRGEIGVRMALGARPAEVRRMVLEQSVALAGLGIVLGWGGAIPLTRVLDALLFGVQPADPVTLATVSGALLALAGVASFVPARRATRVDPVEALRAE